MIAIESEHDPFAVHCFKITRQGPYEDPFDRPIIAIEPVKFEILAERATDWFTCKTDLVPGKETKESFVRVQTAPEVLAVNSDFDEGRIDPVTGYAIPDCDDADISLEAERDHLDGKYKANDRITEDMHPGFFGLEPGSMPNDFWDGPEVTIRKIDKTDPDTNFPEGGQTRMYGKWGDGPSEYRAILPYDFYTLGTANLAAGGIHKVPGESVYGTSSPFSSYTSYFIEGVHPGKITFEWRYKKDDIGLRYEEAFVEETRQSPDGWKRDLAYKIRLDTSNDPSGEIDVNIPPTSVPSGQGGSGAGYWLRMERLSECYDYYRETFLDDFRLQWCGMARLAGSQVVAGISDAHLSHPGSLNFQMNLGIAQKLFGGGYDIFRFASLAASCLSKFIDWSFNLDGRQPQ